MPLLGVPKPDRVNPVCERQKRRFRALKFRDLYQPPLDCSRLRHASGPGRKHAYGLTEDQNVARTGLHENDQTGWA